MTPEEIDHVQLTLGSLVVAFSELEEAVASGIAEFFPSDCFKEIELLTNALLSLKKGLEVLDAVVRSKCTVPETVQTWKKWKHEAYSSQDKRYTYLHSIWEWNVRHKDGVRVGLLRRKRIRLRKGQIRRDDEIPNPQELIDCA